MRIGWLAALVMTIVLIAQATWRGGAPEQADPAAATVPVRADIASDSAEVSSGLRAAPPAPIDEDARQLRRTPVVDVFERCRNAVVNISSREIVTVRSPFGSLFDMFDAPRPGGRGGRQVERQSVGSGFVIHPEGYIITNAHVVARTTDRKAIFPDGREYEARIIAVDEESDLAMLKVDAGQPLETLPFGRSTDLMIGETVIAIGNPLGFQHTVTAGVVSALDRDLQFSRDQVMRGLIQTDASINPGNSGGPLLNVLGELIGVNAAIRGDAQNMSFAIPVDKLQRVLPDLLDVHRRYGFTSGLVVSSFDAAQVIGVEPGSPAQQAGFRVGDLITSIDGETVNRAVDYHIGLIGRRPGDEIDVLVSRDGKPVERELRLGVRPRPDGRQLASRRLGVEMQLLPNDLARRMRLANGTGLLVTDVERGGPADRAGVEAGDVLLALGRYAVDDFDDIGELLETAEGGDDVRISVLRVDRRGKSQLWGSVEVR
ncbi:MAG: trypsin-like peptidase domain-containing protein [Planctomycetota bacterium]|jgi:serine protease Do